MNLNHTIKELKNGMDGKLWLDYLPKYELLYKLIGKHNSLKGGSLRDLSDLSLILVKGMQYALDENIRLRQEIAEIQAREKTPDTSGISGGQKSNVL